MKNRRSRSAFQAALLTAMLGTTALTPAYAQEAPEAVRDFAIEAQPLMTALLEFSRQTNAPVVAPASLTAGREAPAVQGRMDDQAALAMLLDGSGLRAVRGPSGGWAVTVSPDPQSGSAAGDGAEGTVEALIVTAQKREEDIQDVPIAISAFTQEDLTRSQVAGGPDLMTQVPNFTFTKTNFSGYSIQIRGIGTQAISATTDPAVAVAFNNTPFIRNRFFEQEFYDLERVEVLRGPQGTLYGRNATAGVVNIISAKPKFNFEARASADIANYNSSRIEGMINMPLFEDKAALRIAGAWTKREGFVTNTLTGEQTDGRNLWSARVSLRVEPVDWFSANLIYEHFEEDDDRLRSGKQLCKKDPGPATVNGVPIEITGDPFWNGADAIVYFTQGCLPASPYSPDSFQTPNGFALPYGPAASLIGAPVATDLETYESAFQSRDLREIETRFTPEYSAASNVVELQLRFDLPHDLTLASETGFATDRLYSFQDLNRFSTRPGTITTPSGVICNPQIGCSDRMMAGDLSWARSQHFSQEFRLSSDYEGPFNFNLGANFLRYDTEDKYYVFINTLTPVTAACGEFEPTVGCTPLLFLTGYQWSDPSVDYGMPPWEPVYSDNNNIHYLTDLGRNYFLSKNPYGLRSYAAFGEVYYDLSRNLRLTAGFRWTVDRKTAPQIPSWLLSGNSYGLRPRKVIRQEWREPTGRISLDWKPDLPFTDETLVYGSYVRGYKAGGANPPNMVMIFAPVSCEWCDDFGDFRDLQVSESLTHPETFDPEFVDAFEIGTKNTLLDGRLTFNLNAFYYDYTGYQISHIVDRSAVNLNFDAEIWGSELEIDWRPLENLRLGFKGGYEQTRMADGSEAIDLMDRTAGMPGWILHKPFPTNPSSCIMPEERALDMDARFICELYKIDTIFPDAVPWDAPNNGDGFAKDLSGNELPNAPDFTATITADYTLPLPSDWLVTLHTDLYYQSEAWTRIFNTEGYDKLKAYTNINLAAIFTNEDAGWTVMAYVKNLMDRDSITGAFLNSDDTGLTTNVFLTEPRLYGLRVTKNWSGSEWWSARANQSGHYPYRLEVFGDYGRTSGGQEILFPETALLFPEDRRYPLGVQNNLDWGGAGGVKFTWRPQAQGWFLSGAVRYGRTRGDAEEHPQWAPPGGYRLTANYGPETYFDPTELYAPIFNYATTRAKNEETHTVVDFAIGRDVGLGILSASRIELGLQYGRFRSNAHAGLHGRPDVTFPEENIFKYGGTWHRFHGRLDAQREFEGWGPSLSWEASRQLFGDAANGRFDLEIGLGGSVLFGRQTTDVDGVVSGDYQYDFYKFIGGSGAQFRDAYSTPLDNRRSKDATVPGANASIGLSYTLGGLKVSGGYRVERYFDVIDGGITERKTYDRQFDGPYFKVSVGFGG